METSAGPDATETTHGPGEIKRGDLTAVGSLVAEPERRTALTSLGPEARLTPELYAQAVKAVAGGVRRHASLVLAGIPSRTADTWLAITAGRLQRWPDGSPLSKETVVFLARLADDFARAEAEREAAVIQNIAAAAQAVNDKTGIPEWRAGAWLLEHGPAWKRNYAEYREQHIEHGGLVNHDHRAVAQMGDQELLEALPAEWRELVPEVPD